MYLYKALRKMESMSLREENIAYTASGRWGGLGESTPFKLGTNPAPKRYQELDDHVLDL